MLMNAIINLGKLINKKIFDTLPMIARSCRWINYKEIGIKW